MKQALPLELLALRWKVMIISHSPLKESKRKGKPPGSAHKETASQVRVMEKQDINQILNVGCQLKRNTTTWLTNTRKG